MRREKWLPVVGFEGRYEVSSRGRVRSLDSVRRDGNPLRGRVMRPSRHPRTGHLRVVLWTLDGRQLTRLVHRLVLEAFVGPCPDGLQGLHWDDDPGNNAVKNLYWGTSSQNRKDSIRNGGHNWFRDNVYVGSVR